MYEQVCDAEYRVVVILADIDIYPLSIGLYYNSVKGQGQGHPLVFLDTAVVMGIQIGELVRLV